MTSHKTWTVVQLPLSTDKDEVTLTNTLNEKEEAGLELEHICRVDGKILLLYREK